MAWTSRFDALSAGSALRRERQIKRSDEHGKALPFVAYRLHQAMIEVRQTAEYAKWFASLRDLKARARIDVRIRRLSLGNPSDVKPVGEGVSELRVDYGPGYRVYFAQRGQIVALLLCGGDKRTQDRDIERAKALAREWKE